MHPIIEGLNILANYYPNDKFAAAYDQIWYAPYEPSKIKTDDFNKLKELGWYEDSGAWSFFC